MAGYTRRPEWLKLSALEPTILKKVTKLTRDLKLHTVCESARCPNRTKCFAEGTARGRGGSGNQRLPSPVRPETSRPVID